MSYTTRPSPQRIRARRRSALAVLIAVSAAVLAVTATGRSSSPSRVRLELHGRPLASITLKTPDGRRLASTAIEAAVRRRIAPTISVRKAGARVTFAVDRHGTAGAVARRRASARTVEVAARPVASTVAAPVVAQALRNNCETAALEVLLRTLGIRARQLDLQAQIERNGPADPQGIAPDQVWGDPELGYVGRADGSGPAGGFGVYERPIARLAAKHGAHLEDLTPASPQRVYDRLLEGRAVMVWVGLDDGPYGSWRSPAGKPVRVNFNEHTVVLTGMQRDGSLEVVNVLHGTREVWSRALFEERFARLGGRALAASSLPLG